MDDREFFQKLLELFEDTSGAANTYWYFEDTGETGFDIWAVNKDDDKEFIGYFDKEADADFVTAVHGCLPDLVRRLNMALDAEELADESRDSRECRIFELESEVSEIKNVLDGLSKQPPWKKHDDA
jgi:hypothetical protein